MHRSLLACLSISSSTPLPRRSLTCVRLLRHLPGRGSPRSWFARLHPDGTEAQTSVARRAGAHGPVRAAAARADAPASAGAGTSRDGPRSGRSEDRGELFDPAQERLNVQFEVGEAVRERSERQRRGDAAAIVAAAVRAHPRASRRGRWPSSRRPDPRGHERLCNGAEGCARPRLARLGSACVEVRRRVDSGGELSLSGESSPKTACWTATREGETVDLAPGKRIPC